MYSKGISWIDDCRIPFVDDGDKGVFNKNSEGINRQKNSNVMETYMNNSFIIGNHKIDDTRQQGRFPANLLVSDDMLNDGSVSSIKQNKDYIPPNEANSIHNYSRGKYSGIQDKGTNSRYYDLDRWFDNLIK
jgi:hypothetical protein